MRFTKGYDDEEVVEDSGTKRYIKHFKKPQTTFRLLEEKEAWRSYWEHFNPGGYPFPCTGDRSECPGCTSDSEQVRKASKRVAINVLEGDWVNVYKFPKTLADKFANRADRIGTITDREYTVYKNQEKNSDGSIRTDYDIEAEDKVKLDISKFDLIDVEELLSEAYEQSWGNGHATETKLRAADSAEMEKAKAFAKDAKAKKGQAEDPPFEQGQQKVYTEEELRKLEPAVLVQVMKDEGQTPPKGWRKMTTDALVDWLLEQ